MKATGRHKPSVRAWIWCGRRASRLWPGCAPPLPPGHKQCARAAEGSAPAAHRREAGDDRAAPSDAAGRPAVRLVVIGRSTYYGAPRVEKPENLALMRAIDEQFLVTPWYGVTADGAASSPCRHVAGRKRVRPLIARVGLAAVYPRQRLRTTVGIRNTASGRIFCGT
jgi:hypothetical protein